MNYLMFGAVLGFLLVVIGAFGAHGLKNILSEYGTSIFNKAILYQMFHTIAILFLGLLNKLEPDLQLHLVGWSFLLGIILFSGSLYLLAITDIKLLGTITPIGGLFFIIGWVLLIKNII